jgi:MFS family permease
VAVIDIVVALWDYTGKKMSDDEPRAPNKWVALGSSCYMCIVAGGIMYGWPSLLIMLQAEGDFSELCNADAPPPCAAQESYYHWVWTACSSVCLASSLATGLLLDMLGPRVCSTICTVGVLLGCALLGVHDSASCNTLLIGMILIGGFGPGVQNACVSTSNLFQSRSVVSSLIIGSFSISYASFLLLEWLSTMIPATRRAMLLGYCIPVLGAVLLSLVVLPMKPFVAPRKGDPLLGGPSSPKYEASPKAAAATLAVGRAHTEQLVTVLLSEAPVHKQAVSWPFINLVVWVTVQVFWANFYLGTVASRLGGGGIVRTVGEKQREAYIELFNLLSPVGVLFLPVIGYIFDRVSVPLGLLVTTLFGIGFTALLFVPSKVALVGAWVCYTLFRNCAFASLFATLTHYLGYTNLGVLVGLALLASGCASMLQPLIIRLIDAQLDGQYFYVNCTQLACLVAILYFPALAFYKEHRLKRTDSSESISIYI